MYRARYRSFTIHENDKISYNDSNGAMYISGSSISTQRYKKMMPHYWFELEFDSYHYEEIYQPHKKCVQKVALGKVYHLYFCANVPKIIDPPLANKLKHYLAHIQMIQIIEKKNYEIDTIDGKRFVADAEKDNFMLPWHTCQINDEFAFDLITREMVPLAKIALKKNGGIIETNSPRKLVSEYFDDDCSKYFVILPKLMSQIWKKKNAHIMTYDELIHVKKSELDKIASKKWKKIIIHESHFQFLICVRNLLKRLQCDTVWVINALPIRTYLREHEGMLNCLNQIWLGVSISQHRLDIHRFIHTKIHTMYAQINYKSINIDKHMSIMSNKNETQISTCIKSYYDKWKNNLSNDLGNKYSFANVKKLDVIHKNLVNAMLTLSLSITDKSNLKRLMNSKIDKTLCMLKENRYIYGKIRNKAWAQDALDMENIDQQMELNDKKIVDYVRYFTDVNKFACGDSTNTCPICYEPFVDSEVAKVNLICDHHVCVECMIRSLTNNNECPICREYVTVNEMAIVHENNVSDLTNCFKSMDKHTIILSDFVAIENAILNFYDKDAPHFFNLNDELLTNRIRKLSKINKVYVITSRGIKCHKYMSNYAGYFASFNVQPQIIQIDIPVL